MPCRKRSRDAAGYVQDREQMGTGRWQVMDQKKKTKRGTGYLCAFLMLAVYISLTLHGCNSGRNEIITEETEEDKVQEDTVEGKEYVIWVWGEKNEGGWAAGSKGKKAEGGGSTKEHIITGVMWMYYGEKEVPFADEETFERIREAYEAVDYSAEAEKGNPEVYEEYKQKFRSLVQNEVPFLDRETGREIYIDDWKAETGYPILPFVSSFYFFDVNGDSLPELCILSRRTAIFTYDADTDQIILWTLFRRRQELTGTRTGACYPTLYNSEIYEFFELDPHGGVRLEILFWAEHEDLYHYDINMVMFPDYDANGKSWEPTEEMKRQGIYEKSSGQWFFRITDEQFEELEKAYVEAVVPALEKMREERLTYEELFGE